MANELYDSFLRRLSDAVDEFIVHQTRSGRIIIADTPRLDDERLFAEERDTQAALLRKAVTYAEFALGHEAYVNTAMETGASPYTIALADWFGAPRVLEINVDAWTGERGQLIRVKARDNVLVARVTLVIRDAQENMLEMGEAVQAEPGSAWWHYTTRSAVSIEPFPILEATAEDLPGNSDTFVVS